MIKKQKLWYLTLLSLVLVLGIYYVTMPTEILETTKKKIDNKEIAVVEEIKEENILATMRISLEEERDEKINNLQERLSDTNISSEDKNNIYEELKYLNEIQGKEENIEKKLKKELNLDCFVKEEKQELTCICLSNEHDTKLANNIMRTIQKEYKDKIDVQVKFKKNKIHNK